MKRVSVFSMILLLVVTLSACDKQQVSGIVEPNDAQLEKRFSLGGAPIDVVISLSAGSIKLTDILTVTVRVEHAEDVQLQAPYLSEAVYAPLMLISNPSENTQWSESRNRVVSSWQYRFEPMSSGDFALNPFKVYFRLDSEKTDDPEQWPVYKIETEAIPYQVTSVSIENQDGIRDIKDLILPPYDFLPIIVTALGIAAVFIGIWGVHRIRSRAGKADKRDPEPVDYRMESLKRLEELEKKDYISRKEYERLHVELSGIMRYFIEHRFALRALEQTTEEFIRDIQHSPHFDLEQQSILQQFLKLADLVKFATYDPGPGASGEALETVRSFIETTGNSHEH